MGAVGVGHRLLVDEGVVPGVVAVPHPGVDADRAVVLLGVVPGALQCLGGALQKQALLGVDQFRLAGAVAEVARVEVLDVLQHPATGDEVLGEGVVAEARGTDLVGGGGGDGLQTVDQDLPVLLGRAGTGETAGHADHRDVDTVVVLPRFAVTAHRSSLLGSVASVRDRLLGFGQLAQVGGERGHGGVAEQLRERHGHPELLGQSGVRSDEEQRMPTEVEEVVVQADVLPLQHVAPDAEHEPLHAVARRDALSRRLGVRPWWFGQAGAVDLAADRARELGKGDDVVRHQVRGKLAPQELLDRGDVHCRLIADDVPAQAAFARPRGGHRRGCLPHARRLAQGGLHLTQLDPETADLDLVVDAPTELQGPVASPAHHVPGPVHPLTGPVGERVGHEPFRRERGVAEVAQPHPRSGDVQLPENPGGRELAGGVEHVDPRVPQRATEADVGFLGRAQLGAGGYHRCLRRAVDVDDPAGTGVEHRACRRRRQLLTTGDVGAQPVGQRARPQQLTHHGGHGEEVAGPPRRLGWERGHVQGVVHQDDPAAEGQGHPQVQHRGVEADRGGRHRTRQFVVVEQMSAPGQQVTHGVVRDHRALGATGRAAGVDDVGRVPAGNRPVVGGVLDVGGVGAVHGEHRTGEVGEPRRVPGDQGGGGGVGEHERPPLGWVVGFDRHVSAPGAQHREHRDHQIGFAWQADPDPDVRTDPRRPQPSGQTSGFALQLAVGDAARRMPDRDRVRLLRRRPAHQLRERGVGHLDLRPAVSAEFEQFRALGEADQWEGGHPRRGSGRDTGEQGREAAAESVDGLGVEQGGRVLERAPEPVVGLGHVQRQVELRRVGVLSLVLQGEVTDPHLRARGPLEHEDVLEQRVVAGVPLGRDLLDHRLERHVLVGHRVHAGPTHRGQQVGERGIT